PATSSKTRSRVRGPAPATASPRWFGGHPARAGPLIEHLRRHRQEGPAWKSKRSPEEERAGYEASIRSIERASRTRPVGFNAFWLRGTPHTPGILQAPPSRRDDDCGDIIVSVPRFGSFSGTRRLVPRWSAGVPTR